MGSSKSGVCGYGGLRLNVALSNQARLTPFGGVGGYAQGNGKNLGGSFVFVGGLEYGHQLKNDRWLGFAFYHISNAYTRPENPGAESFAVMLQLPLERPEGALRPQPPREAP
jgi:hypothetical protein